LPEWIQIAMRPLSQVCGKKVATQGAEWEFRIKLRLTTKAEGQAANGRIIPTFAVKGHGSMASIPYGSAGPNLPGFWVAALH
jgi:hypothetical protein